MEERLTLKQVLRFLGLPEERGKIENGDIVGSSFERYPGRVAKLGAALAAEFAEDQIDLVVGFLYQSLVLAQCTAQSLYQYSGEVAVVPLWVNPFKEGAIVIEYKDAKFLEGKRALVVAPEASRVMLWKRVSDLCREHKASWVAVGLIANFACSPEFLGGDKVRSLIDCPSV